MVDVGLFNLRKSQLGGGKSQLDKIRKPLPNAGLMVLHEDLHLEFERNRLFAESRDNAQTAVSLNIGGRQFQHKRQSSRYGRPSGKENIQVNNEAYSSMKNPTHLRVDNKYYNSFNPNK